MTEYPVVGGPANGLTVELSDGMAPPSYAVGSVGVPDGDDGRPQPFEGHLGDHLYVFRDGKYVYWKQYGVVSDFPGSGLTQGVDMLGGDQS